MKSIVHIILVLFSALFITSCRDTNDIPEDIHEHEELEKMTVTLINTANSNDTQTINYIGGVADHPIQVTPGSTYTVSLDFFVGHDGHYHSAIHEIEEEKDEHFITYQFAGMDTNLERNTDDILRTDGKKLGLKTTWTVTNVQANAKVNIQLVHGASSVNDQSPSTTQQFGSTVGGNADINALINVQ